MPAPSQAVYGATKAALSSFSEALAAEVRPHGVQVTVGMPGVTKTRFRSRQGVTDEHSIQAPSKFVSIRKEYAFRGHLHTVFTMIICYRR